MSVSAGYRLLPHTADLMIEAWGPDKAACMAEAVEGLVASFADTKGRTPTTTARLHVETAPADEQLVAVLEEVIYLLDAGGVVPVEITLVDSDAGLKGSFGMVPLDQVTPIGPAPKAVTLHGLDIHSGDRGWSCRVVIDV